MESTETPKKKRWFRRHPLLTTALIVMGLFVLGNAIDTLPEPSQSVKVDNEHLDITVTTDESGISITNNETVDWNDCMTGVNGSTGWGFNNPPYRTHSALSVAAGQTHVVPYQQVTAEDGQRFNYDTHGINTVVVLCNQDDPASWRSWVGNKQ